MSKEENDTNAIEKITDYLLSEQLHHMQWRNQMLYQKIVFSGTLIGLGGFEYVLKAHLTDTPPGTPYIVTFYLVPFVAIAYDLFISTEDYKVKRVGCFFKQQAKEQQCGWLEVRKRWEDFVADHRETVAFYYGSLILSLLTIIPGLLNSLSIVDYNHWFTRENMLVGCWFLATSISAVVVSAYNKSRISRMMGEKVSCPVFGWLVQWFVCIQKEGKGARQALDRSR